MEIVKAQQSFRGPMIAVITHLNDDLSIDHGAIRANINSVIEHGFGYGHGALPGGGAGGVFPCCPSSNARRSRRPLSKQLTDESPC